MASGVTRRTLLAWQQRTVTGAFPYQCRHHSSRCARTLVTMTTGVETQAVNRHLLACDGFIPSSGEIADVSI